MLLPLVTPLTPALGGLFAFSLIPDGDDEEEKEEGQEGDAEDVAGNKDCMDAAGGGNAGDDEEEVAVLVVVVATAAGVGLSFRFLL